MNKSKVSTRIEVNFGDDHFDEDYSLIVVVSPDNQDCASLIVFQSTLFF